MGRTYAEHRAEQSRQFGFLRFATLQQAEDFMERNYPNLYLYGTGTGGAEEAKVRIAFSRERKGPQDKDEPDWICKVVGIEDVALWMPLSSPVQYQQLCHTRSMLQMSIAQSRCVDFPHILACSNVNRLRGTTSGQSIQYWR